MLQCSTLVSCNTSHLPPQRVCQAGRVAGSCAERAGVTASSCPKSCSTFAKLDVWLEQNSVLNELTEAPRTQMEGTLSPEQKEASDSRVSTLAGWSGGLATWMMPRGCGNFPACCMWLIAVALSAQRPHAQALAKVRSLMLDGAKLSPSQACCPTHHSAHLP